MAQQSLLERAYSGGGYFKLGRTMQIGEEALVIYDKIRALEESDFFITLRQAGLEAVVSSHQDEKTKQVTPEAIIFVKPDDYCPSDIPTKPSSEGWNQLRIYNPTSSVKEWVTKSGEGYCTFEEDLKPALVEDLLYTVNRLNIIPGDGIIRFSTMRVKWSAYETGHLWIDQGQSTLKNEDIVCEVLDRGVPFTPLAVPLSSVCIFKEHKPKITKLGEVRLDDIFYAYAANFNDRIRRNTP